MDRLRRKPNFITVEGIDGVGKTTAVNVINEVLQLKGLNTLVIRQNRDTLLGQLVRGYMQDFNTVDTAVDTLAYLYCASINDTITRLVEPAHLSGKIVISDRYTMSTRVYQSASCHVDSLCTGIESTLSPDITFLLDAPPSIVKQRINDRQESTDVMENVPCTILNERRKGFMRLARQCPEKNYIIDASGTADYVAQQITNILNKYYR